MHFKRLVPNIFYKDINIGINLFVNCLDLKIGHDERHNFHQPFCVVEKDDLHINLFQDVKYATDNHPEFRLVTDNIEEVYAKVKASHPELLHPNLKVVTLRPWGAKEFALMDMQLGVRVQQW